MRMSSKDPVMDPREYLNGSYDLGLGYCLQCTAEYKMSGEQQAKFPRFACLTAPIAGMQGTGGACYEHLNVQPPAPLPPPPVQHTPVQLPADEKGNLYLPNGQPLRARHAR
jgi:hypothetical protein